MIPRPNENVEALVEQCSNLRDHFVSCHVDITFQTCDYCPTKCPDNFCLRIETEIKKFTDLKTEILTDKDSYYYCLTENVFFYARKPKEIAEVIGISKEEFDNIKQGGLPFPYSGK